MIGKFSAFSHALLLAESLISVILFASYDELIDVIAIKRGVAHWLYGNRYGLLGHHGRHHALELSD